MMESKISKMPEAGCFLVVHCEEIEGNEYFVNHYQESEPNDAAMAVLREDALIKCQLRAGDNNKG